MKSSLTEISDHQEILPTRRRRDRIDSLQIAASGRRNTIHAVAIGLLAAQKRTSIVEEYTSRARKAYRERRASYHKQKHKTFKVGGPFRYKGSFLNGMHSSISVSQRRKLKKQL